MDFFANIILVIAVAFPFIQIFTIRKYLLNRNLNKKITFNVFSPVVATVFVFILSIILVINLSLSPFHLLWMFFISAALGAALVAIKSVRKITFSFLSFISTSRV